MNEPQWGRESYLVSHIKGAYYLDLNEDLSSPVKKHGGRHPLPDSQGLSEQLTSLGIVSQKTQVVVYDDARLAFASRWWWLLRYLGHEEVALLDGGWHRWLELGYPVDTEIPRTRAGDFLPKPRTEWLVDINYLKERGQQPGVVLIDSREEDRYRGVREPIDPIAGHIPGALNSPWVLVTDHKGYVRPIKTQAQLWQDHQDAKEIILYCGSGVTACVNYLSLSLLGYQNVKLYVGGWSDWCSHQESQIT